MPGAVKVLVVEDEPLLRMGIVDHLEDVGFSVLEAGTAHEALHLLERHAEIEIVFTDVDMPGGMGGVELAAQVSERWPQIGIAVTSGFRHVNLDELPARSLFFPKPYDPAAIGRALSDLARRP